MLGASDGIKGHRREEASDGTERKKERERQERPATKEGTKGEAEAGEDATIAHLIVRSRTVSPGGHLLLMQPRHPRELGIHKYAGPVNTQTDIQFSTYTLA